MSDRIFLKLFVDCLEKYQKLNDTEFGRLVRAALRYKATGAEPDDLGREALLWDGMRLDIDRDNERYAEIVENRSESGKKGAQARWQNHKSDSKNSKCHLPYGKNAYDKEKDKDKEEDKDKDKEKEKIIPPKSPQGDLQGELSKSSLSDDVKSALSEWLDYKRERKEKYTLTGWKKLLTITARQIENHRESDVIALIEESMANGWQGIIWDRLKRGERQNRTDTAPDPAPTPEYIPPTPEMDEHRVLLDPDKPFNLDDYLP